MTASTDATAMSDSSPQALAPLPPALSSMWRLCRLGYRHEPKLMAVAFALSQAQAVPDALVALWLMWLGRGVADQRPALVMAAALGLGLSAVATWFLRTVSTRVQRTFRDKVTIALEAHVAKLQASIATIAHHERPDYLDRLAMLRDQVFVLDHMYMSVFSMCGLVLRLAIVVVLLTTIHPILAALLVCALPIAGVSMWRPGVERVVHEQGAQSQRQAAHLFALATTLSPAKEVRLSHLGPRLEVERRVAWERGHAPLARVRWSTALWSAAAWAVFGGAYAAAIAFVSASLRAPADQVVLVLAAGARLSGYVSATVTELGFLRGFWMDGSRRLAWLEDYAASTHAHTPAGVPSRVSEGIRLDRVSFAYPGTRRLVLEDVSLSLPAGSVVAIVGENGAGKSTLVKLLAKMYEPTAGTITVDGVPLTQIPAADWRRRLSGAFQDFFKFELRARHTVGVGDLPRADDERAVRGAVERAGADDVVDRFAWGLDTQLGANWPDGVDLSFGQWQKLSLARGFMREMPLMLVLDEPTAALDAETEHALFERFAAAARRPGAPRDGQVTILVSHRFSTVRMADLIVVLDGAHLVEYGSHDALMTRGGTYAELYALQAAAYRTRPVIPPPA